MRYSEEEERIWCSIAKWIKGELRELFADLLSPDRLRQEGFLNPDYVTRLLQDHLAQQEG